MECHRLEITVGGEVSTSDEFKSNVSSLFCSMAYHNISQCQSQVAGVSLVNWSPNYGLV
jgi:hypothetical protein